MILACPCMSLTFRWVPAASPVEPDSTARRNGQARIGVIEGYVPPLPPPLAVTVHEYVEPGLTAETQLALWNASPLVDHLPLDETGITCWKQEDLTMLSKFCNNIINVHCLRPHLFNTHGNLRDLAENRGDIHIPQSIISKLASQGDLHQPIFFALDSFRWKARKWHWSSHTYWKNVSACHGQWCAQGKIK